MKPEIGRDQDQVWEDFNEEDPDLVGYEIRIWDFKEKCHTLKIKGTGAYKIKSSHIIM